MAVEDLKVHVEKMNEIVKGLERILYLCEQISVEINKIQNNPLT